MSRLMAVALVPWVFAAAVFVSAQTSTSNNPVSDPQALALASKSFLALTGGNSVTDISLTGDATLIAGSDRETGPANFYAKSTTESRVDLNLSGGERSEVRFSVGGMPQGKWKKNTASVQTEALHNSWADAAWFFPALSSLSQTSNPALVFKYIGREQKNGLSVEHLRVSKTLPSDTNRVFLAPQLSQMDFYLDGTSLLPMDLDFYLYPEDNMNTKIQVEVRFADYRNVNGVQVPFHVQRLLNGGLALDVVVSNAVLNSGLSDAQFTLQ